jgi:hypothetical protein
MDLGYGTAAGATDIAGQRAVLPASRIQKERVIVPWAGRRHSVMGVSGSDAPVLDGLTTFIFSIIAEHIQASPRLGSSFLSNP